MEPSFTPVHIFFPLPKNPHLTFHAHLSFLGHCSMVHLTTTNVGESDNQLPSMGSFVYAMPDMTDNRNVISTALSTSVPSIDYATRVAKILARRMKQPVYVGCSINLAGTFVEEELEGLTTAVDRIMQKWSQRS
ncbi:uncharacterized protein Z518_03645 [Rhinocladiella mackenziei CBS 650.93]|uniref:Proteasome assembly chaperone 3 n=1 Tax=Rhinocladiella mackenziei CBS 650.93 TaxID=1442369 RepID=A0A0D2H5I2_9EURO|nr:uncharacterized protein Z518_03645 [Rhinocladiella mackenziei CBS 650.93]KIX05673.1 hypothetical protein Z518_03645 [Rhinocladiella mackenziei CBS 650.93]